jgi:hypothetical protein
LKGNDFNGKDKAMQSQTELIDRISNTLEVGVHFSQYMSLISEEPEFDILEQELRAAYSWIYRTQEQSGPPNAETAPDIVRLLRRCAEVTEECGYEFLAADFEHLADESIRLGNGGAASEGRAQ